MHILENRGGLRLPPAGANNVDAIPMARESAQSLYEWPVQTARYG
jgi:hypothetical protein